MMTHMFASLIAPMVSILIQPAASLLIIALSGKGQEGGFLPLLALLAFPVTFENLGIRSQTFLTFTFNHCSKLVQNIEPIPSASFKLLNLNQGHPQKNCFFWSNSYKI